MDVLEEMAEPVKMLQAQLFKLTEAARRPKMMMTLNPTTKEGEVALNMFDGYLDEVLPVAEVNIGKNPMANSGELVHSDHFEFVLEDEDDSRRRCQRCRRWVLRASEEDSLLLCPRCEAVVEELTNKKNVARNL